jgi:hypothetical protein
LGETVVDKNVLPTYLITQCPDIYLSLANFNKMRVQLYYVSLENFGKELGISLG